MKFKTIYLTILLSISIFSILFSQEKLKFLNKNTYEYDINGEKIILKLTDTDPNHFPVINLTHGFGFSGTPHSPINVTNHIDGYFNFANYGAIDIKYTYLSGFWKNYYIEEFVTRGDNYATPSAFSSIDLMGHIRIFKKLVKKDILVFFKQESMSYHYKTTTYLNVPANYLRYFDISIGYLHYRDIISDGIKDKDEKLMVTTTNGSQIEDIFINNKNQIFQFGGVYGKEYYVRGMAGKRCLQKVCSKRIYFNVLYLLNSKIDDIQYNGNVYTVDAENSGLEINKIGLKIGYSKTETIITSLIGAKLGFEIGLYPGINGFPGGIYNLYGRFYASYSLHFLKKLSQDWKI